MAKFNQQSINVSELRLALLKALGTHKYTEIECIKALNEVQQLIISNMASDERKSG